MPNDITSSGITATIPSLTDNADIVTAFTSYHEDVASAINGKANATNPSITGTVTASGIITANAGTYSTSTVTLVGQANAAIASGRYNANATGATFNGNASDTSATRIFVSKATPTANLTTGDIWVSWS